MATLHIDFETRSTCDLKKAGSYVYAADPTTDVWCMAYALDDGPVDLWIPGQTFPLTLTPDTKIIAHNAAFELAIWNGLMAPRYGWPVLPIEQTYCTMAMAYALALPGSLENAAAAVGLTVGKDMQGRRLMMQMSSPRRVEEDGTLIWWDDADRKERLYAYCKQDIEVERALEKRLVPLSETERKLWVLDQTINGRGVGLDMKAVAAAITLVEEEKERLNKQIKAHTQGRVGSCSQVAELTRWLQEKGLTVDGLAKADVVTLLDLENDLPEDARAALICRQEAAKSSTAKLKSMKEGASADGRVRGIFQYHGASTGRWAGRRLQPQNFPRGHLSAKDVDWVLTLLDQETDAGGVIDLVYGSPMQVMSDCLRGLIVPKPGHDLMAADFSAIEARVLAWLAGQEDVLAIFRGHGKIYEHAASGIYNRPMAEITKDQRQIGKVAVLALGYQGGVGAFQAMARGYGLVIDDAKADSIKTAWRAANKHIVRYWYALEDAAKDAVRAPGKVFVAGAKGREVKFKKSGSFLFARLPSGRLLSYPYPQVTEKETKFGLREVLSYKTTNAVTKAWGEADSYGGLLCENVTQAVARDLLAHAMLTLETHGYPIVMTIHDEIVCEVGENCGSVEEMESLMSQTPAWATNLPVSAEGWRGKRYRK
jgi:DNA polymerase